MVYSNPELINFGIFIRDCVTGLLFLSLVLIFHSACVARIITVFESRTAILISQQKYTSIVIGVYNPLSLFTMTHIAGVLIWATALYYLELLNTPMNAILFAGSCYLTLDFIGDVLPDDWKSLALFIAFSGLLVTAWTTSAMVSLINSFKDDWLKRKLLLDRKLRFKHVTRNWSAFDSTLKFAKFHQLPLEEF